MKEHKMVEEVVYDGGSKSEREGTVGLMSRVESKFARKKKGGNRKGIL